MEQQEVGENCIIRSLKNCALRQTIRIITSRRMRWLRARSTLGGEEECIQGFGGKARRKKTTRTT
jgi:hypothetical protein